MPYMDCDIPGVCEPTIENILSEEQNDSGYRVDMLRLDLIHPQLSGNKIFKLSKYLEECRNSPHRTLLTFGGPFSNHLAATAYAAQALSLKSIGLVRGENHQNPTLDFCREMGMELHFVTRIEYDRISSGANNDFLLSEFGLHTNVPYGGYGRDGAEGAKAIMSWIPENTYTHICLPVGSAATLAGLLLADRNESIVGFPAIKNMTDIPQRISKMNVEKFENLKIIQEYHFEGFAKWNHQLIRFMNQFYKQYHIPLDIVYTSKMMFGVMDLLSRKLFAQSSKILCIHTGGLQGNQSLPEKTLEYEG